MMDFTYYNQDCYVEVYAGIIKGEITLKEEVHPLIWIDETEDFFVLDRFAGEGNIGHMIEQVKCYGMGTPEVKNNIMEQSMIDIKSMCIGIDGCKGGWIGAIIDHGKLIINRFNSINSIVEACSNFDEVLVDMVIGLPSNEKHIRPDTFARRIIKERGSTIFPAPCRQAVYAENISLAYEENERVLGKKFTPLTVGIMPKMREIDMFLQENSHYKNVIKESHPEVCFAMLYGKTLISKKSNSDGIEERIIILRRYLPDICLERITYEAKQYKCKVDDIIDAICLAVTANMIVQNKYQIIPDKPMKDESGLIMQMVIPKV